LSQSIIGGWTGAIAPRCCILTRFTFGLSHDQFESAFAATNYETVDRSRRSNRCAQSDFCFAKAYIATHQSVHRARAYHVLNHGMDGCTLVWCFFKTKVVGKRFVIVWRVSKSMTLPGSTAGVDIQQFCSRVAYLLGGFALGFFPLAGSSSNFYY